MSSRVICKPLGECLSQIIDYRGKTPKKLGSNWLSGTDGFRAISAKNVKTGEPLCQLDSIKYVDADLYKKWMKVEVNRNDILLTSEAPFGQVMLWDSDEKIVLSQRLFALRADSVICDAGYLYYWMCSHQFQEELRGRATGTTVIGLRQPELLKCKVALPDLVTQKKIADVLSSIDKKLNINVRINDYLVA